ncbi:MAG: hypothetical protein LBD68_09860 [Zoogloeaceae bacterium]|jgi:hypothetical protein|nr:hypothetical protein [Zoogloeaceae bacterium]
MQKFIFALLVALAAGSVGGGWFGWRYAAGRCAADALDAANVQADAATQALASGIREQHAAVLENKRAAARSAAIENRQMKETANYEKSIAGNTCRIEPDALRLLNDAIRRGNAAIDAAAAD